ncbi:MAG TPA: hypothetical protein DC047_10165 [Blastocatellia bacterium]|nr:hypothetical protein [Blastocatellia bacterium]
MGAESNAGLRVACNGKNEITFGRLLFRDEKVKRYANMRKKSLSTPVIFSCKPNEYCYKQLRDFFEQLQIFVLCN